MSETKIILKQVALKGAVRLVKDQFKVNEDIQTQVDTVTNIADMLNEWLLNGYEDPVVQKLESAGMKSEVKKATGGHTASAGQVKYLRDLLGQLPEEEQQKYKEVVLSDNITWQYAKENIPVMQEKVDESKLNKDKPPF